MQWHYIVPDNYEGYLIIWYECRGGAPLRKVDETIVVMFGDDGVACVSDGFEAIFPYGTISQVDQEVARTKSGQLVPVVAGISGQTGYALVALGNRGHYQDGSDFSLTILYIGNMAKFNQDVESGAANDAEDAFLAQRLGAGVPTSP